MTRGKEIFTNVCLLRDQAEHEGGFKHHGTKLVTLG